MVVKYLFLSYGSYDGYYTFGLIVGKERDIKLIKEELSKIDIELVGLKKSWSENYKIGNADEEEDLLRYTSWKLSCDKYEKLIPKIAYRHNCTYVNIKDDFHFKGMGV